MRTILHLIRKEFIQIRRDRAMRGLILVVPIIQLLVLGYVISSEVKNIRTIICDQDQSVTSRQLVERVAHSPYFTIVGHDRRTQNLHEYLDRGDASMVLVIPMEMEKKLASRQPSEIQILSDGQDANTAGISLGYMSGILEDFLSGEISRLSVDGLHINLIKPVIRVWYNENVRASDFMIPGIVVFLLTLVTSLVSAMGLVREREIGTLEQLLVAPIKKHELLIGKIIPFAILGLLVLTLSVLFARLWYRIPIVGNLALFGSFAVIYLFTTLGIGLLVSAASRTQQQAMFITWFITIFIFLMSGFIFPIENMPQAAQWLSYLNPMRYFILVTREIFIKGSGVTHLYNQGLALIVFGAVIFSFAVMRFHKRMS